MHKKRHPSGHNKQAVSVRPLPLVMGWRFADLTGRIFKRMTVVGYAGKRGARHLWVCRCLCGRDKTVPSGDLISGHTGSCGCLQRDCRHFTLTPPRTHGMYNSPEYLSWRSMKTRCSNSKSPDFQYYGGRGIKVCKRWMKFENFFKDMGRRPIGTTLDRKNGEGGYCKSNCRWADVFEQSNNKRSNRLLTFNGSTQTVAQWSREVGITEDVIHHRLNSGWSEARVFSIPCLRRKKSTNP